MSSDTGNIFAVQIDIAWHDKEQNFVRARRLLKDVVTRPGSLIVFSEMFATGFTMDTEAMGENPDGPTTAFLKEIARERSVYCVGGFIERDPAGAARNVAVHIGPEGDILGRYSKIQPFSPSGESVHYQAGNEIVMWEWNALRIAPFICYDLRFPELFRHAMLAGAEAFLVIASWPKARAGHWVSLLQARAIENQAYVIGVNRTGADPHFEFPGRSLIVDPSGGVLAEAGNGENLISSSIQQANVFEIRQRLPFLKDVRREFLGFGEIATSAAD